MNILTLFEKAIRTFKFHFIVELRSNISQNIYNIVFNQNLLIMINYFGIK